MERRAADYTYITVDGIDNCVRALREICEGGLKKCFIEMSACVGSCVGGPAMDKHGSAVPRDGGGRPLRAGRRFRRR